MDLSLINDQIDAMDDSFLVIRPEAMDDEVTQIFKKWKLNNGLPKKDSENINTTNHNANETFDSRTFTRPAKRRTFNTVDPITNISSLPSITATMTDSEPQSVESGIASINLNLQVGGGMTPLSMQRSWLNDVSPPASICTSMDFQNNDNMLNSLITSGDFSNISFLLNGTTGGHELGELGRRMNSTTIAENGNSTIIATNANNNVSRNLINFTFDVNKTMTNGTFVTDSEPPIKEIGIENTDIQLNESIEDLGKNLTFNKYDNNITWDKINDNHEMKLNQTAIISTPLHANIEINQDTFKKDFGHDEDISPISSFHAQDENEDDNLLLRSFKNRRLIDDIRMDDYRNSMEDQCEFLLNEETIKLSSRVCGGESFECLNDLKNALITSANSNEKEFDEMLDTFNVKKSMESEKLLQSVDSIKQRHSLINMEKQREEKQRQSEDNRSQYDTQMNKSSERLLNRRSRLYDDVNLQLQKQQNETLTINGSAKITNNLEMETNDAENDEVIDKNDRDRFKTIKLNRPRLQTGMVIVDTEESELREMNKNEISPGSNKERRNQINQQMQEDVEFKRPPAPSKLSKFGFSRPSYRNNLNLPLKANSTDSLDNDSESVPKQIVSNLKSPMGIKSKSIHNLMFNGSSAQQQNGMRMSSNLKLNHDTAKSQSNLKAPRASSLVRPGLDNNIKIPQQTSQLRTLANKKPGLMRPSSGYYGNTFSTKRFDSDNESYSLSSSSASSRNSVQEQQVNHQNSLQSTEDLNQFQKKSNAGAIPKPSGISRMSGLPRPQMRSALPRPK